MRAVVIILAVLVAAKVWAQDRLHREAANAALLAAYKLHAEAHVRAAANGRARDAVASVRSIGSSRRRRNSCSATRGSACRSGNSSIHCGMPLQEPVVRLTVGDRYSRLALRLRCDDGQFRVAGALGHAQRRVPCTAICVMKR